MFHRWARASDIGPITQGGANAVDQPSRLNPTMICCPTVPAMSQDTSRNRLT